MTQTKYIGRMSPALAENWEDNVPSYHSYYDFHMKRKAARMAATTGSQSLDADTKAGEKYLRHQLKILWPRMVENNASSKPTTTALKP